ncbi:hypothetical protein JQC92_03155 [Shewanella sp. 202IG2-18]|uniref:VPS10 domain-containing protein n=1 Tax=Parashewanella hymeniacidonis TaxID=2807618 RepID=UPI001960CCF6|nr:glycoside hydrolase [Parashewanella hymeniacidonis]MBM7071040.1 hypothetical protein [Parashewanella hymeniacidonis]
MRIKIAVSLITPLLIMSNVSAATTEHSLTLTPLKINDKVSTLMLYQRSLSNVLLAYDSDNTGAPRQGVWQSTDNGESWSEVVKNQKTGWDQIAFEQQKGEPDVAVALIKNRLSKSTDAGVSWSPYIDSTCNMDVNLKKNWGRITFIPGSSSMMFLEHTTGSQDKMYVSTDQGKTCQPSTLNNGLGNWEITSSNNGDVILAASNGKIERSNDHGKSWQRAEFLDPKTLPSSYDTLSISFDPNDNSKVYAVDTEADIDSKTSSLLWYSRDYGKTWEACSYDDTTPHTHFTSPVYVINKGKNLLFLDIGKFKVTGGDIISPNVEDIKLNSDTKLDDGFISGWAPQAFDAKNNQMIVSHIVEKEGNPEPTQITYLAQIN